MLRYILCVCLAVLFFAPAAVKAEFQKGDFELSLAAAGTTPGNGGDFVMGGNFTLGYFVTDAVEVSLLQGVAYSDVTDNHWAGSTGGEVDYHFSFGKWQPFVGGFVLASYADGAAASQAGGPDAGVKYWVNEKTTVFGKAMWAIPFSNPNGADGNAVDRSSVNYSIGISFRF